MQDPQDTTTPELPLEHSETPAAPEPQATRPKSFRSKYTEAFRLKCAANRDPNAVSLMLLQALVGCDVPHKSVDVAFNMPEGTVQKYLLSGLPVVIDETKTFNDDMALVVFDILFFLHENKAFKGNDLKITGVLQAMLAYKLQVDE